MFQALFCTGIAHQESNPIRIRRLYIVSCCHDSFASSSLVGHFLSALCRGFHFFLLIKIYFVMYSERYSLLKWPSHFSPMIFPSLSNPFRFWLTNSATRPAIPTIYLRGVPSKRTCTAMEKRKCPTLPDHSEAGKVFKWLTRSAKTLLFFYLPSVSS